MKVKISHRKCVECDMPIPIERLRLLPDTYTCVLHSGEKALTAADVELDGSSREDAIESAEGTMWNR